MTERRQRRPRGRTGNPTRDIRVSVSFTEAEHADVSRAADRFGIARAAYIRLAVLMEAKSDKLRNDRGER